MTEPNRTTETDPAAAPAIARASWPLPAEPDGGGGGGVLSADPAVTALLDRLGDLPELPVARHGDVYAALHDDLLAALNGTPQHGTGSTTEPGDAKHEQA